LASDRPEAPGRFFVSRALGFAAASTAGFARQAFSLSAGSRLQPRRQCREPSKMRVDREASMKLDKSKHDGNGKLKNGPFTIAKGVLTKKKVYPSRLELKIAEVS
jgi:hypothetical protein